jgi:hypothetical protein
MSKTLTTSKISDKYRTIIERAWLHNPTLRTKSLAPYLIIKTVDENLLQGIMLPTNNWESLIVFLAESFAFAELEANGKSGEIEIILSIDRKAES